MNVINDQSEQHQNQNHHQQTTMALDPILRLLSSTPATTPSPIQHSTTSTNQPDITPRLPKSRLVQSISLLRSAHNSLKRVWRLLDESRLRITEELDHRFGELHASAVPFKPESLALIWPQCIENKNLRSHSMSRSKSSVVVYSIKKANIGFIAEYVLYAMPGEEAYGKNDIVFACEGFLPLVVDQDWIKEEECWRLFNELKVQIYIQRLDQSGEKEANSKVLPNLFVESLSSYSGLDLLESDIEDRFDEISNQYKNQIVEANSDLQLLKIKYPYDSFLRSILGYLQRCSQRLDLQYTFNSSDNELIQKALNCPYNLSNNTLSLSSSTTPNSNSTLVSNNSKKRQKSSDNPKRRKKNGNNDDDDDNPNFEGSIQVQGPSNLSTINVSGNDFNGRNDSESNCYAEQSRDNISSSTNRIRFEGDISVDPNNQTEEEEELNHSKGKYNPYRLGRGKGVKALPRRRWTEEEYELLLNEVRLHSNKYDCMAQIIKRHGKNGELSEILKEQNNVSLKDKARNLTMEWTKNGYPEDKPWLKEAFARFSVKSSVNPNILSSNSGLQNEGEGFTDVHLGGIGNDRNQSSSGNDNDYRQSISNGDEHYDDTNSNNGNSQEDHNIDDDDDHHHHQNNEDMQDSNDNYTYNDPQNSYTDPNLLSSIPSRTSLSPPMTNVNDTAINMDLLDIQLSASTNNPTDGGYDSRGESNLNENDREGEGRRAGVDGMRDDQVDEILLRSVEAQITIPFEGTEELRIDDGLEETEDPFLKDLIENELIIREIQEELKRHELNESLINGNKGDEPVEGLLEMSLREKGKQREEVQQQEEGRTWLPHVAAGDDDDDEEEGFEIDFEKIIRSKLDQLNQAFSDEHGVTANKSTECQIQGVVGLGDDLISSSSKEFSTCKGPAEMSQVEQEDSTDLTGICRSIEAEEDEVDNGRGTAEEQPRSRSDGSCGTESRQSRSLNDFLDPSLL